MGEIPGNIGGGGSGSVGSLGSGLGTSAAYAFGFISRTISSQFVSDSGSRAALLYGIKGLPRTHIHPFNFLPNPEDISAQFNPESFGGFGFHQGPGVVWYYE